MKITFLGTGGGRINLIKQFRSTAGFFIEGSKIIYVDPGVGVIHQARRFKVPLHLVDVLIVSHPHLDHANDAEVAVEAMTRATLKKRGVIIADSLSLHGSGFVGNLISIVAEIFPIKHTYFERALSLYHQSLVDRVYELLPGKIIKFNNTTIKGTKTKHDDPAVGFVLEMDGKRIGYTSDTEYFEGLSQQFNDCDVIVINMLRFTKPEFSGHMWPETVTKFLKEANPKMAILTHFGGQFIKTNADNVAKGITKESGVKTFAARDGRRFDI